jgi:hypothetical protein
VARRCGNGEGSIYKRTDGRWVGQYFGYTVKGPTYRYIYGKTRQAVAEKLARVLSERDGGLVFDSGKLTVAEYMDRWLRESARNRLRLKTYEDYSGLTRRHIAPALGHVKLKKLTPLHLQQFYGAKLESGLSKRNSRIFARRAALGTQAGCQVETGTSQRDRGRGSAAS